MRLQAGGDARAYVVDAPLYEEFGITGNPALMRVARCPQAREGGEE
ncbi:hypothetical protein [Streptomyces sp. NPDC093795]